MQAIKLAAKPRERRLVEKQDGDLEKLQAEPVGRRSAMGRPGSRGRHRGGGPPRRSERRREGRRRRGCRWRSPRHSRWCVYRRCLRPRRRFGRLTVAFLTIALTILAVAFPIVVYVRVKSDGENPGPLLGFVAGVAAYAFGGGATLTAIVVPLSLPIIPDPIFETDTWVGRLLAGATAGAILFLALRVLFYDLSLAVLDWSLRRPSLNVDSRAEKLRWIAGGTVGFAAIFGAIFLVSDALGSRSELWLIPFFVLIAAAFSPLRDHASALAAVSQASGLSVAGNARSPTMA